jgi:hypothetical protein
MSPYALQHGYITEALNVGQPKDVTANRVDIPRELIDQHYDKRRGTSIWNGEKSTLWTFS